MTATTTAPAETTSDDKYVRLVGHKHSLMHWALRGTKWKASATCYGGMFVDDDAGYRAACGAMGLKAWSAKQLIRLTACEECARIVGEPG